MTYKIKIADTSGLFSFRFLNSAYSNVYYTDGDIVQTTTPYFQHKYDSNATTVTSTAYLYVYDKYDNLLKTIAVISDTIDTANTFTIADTEKLLTTKFQEDTDFGAATTTITYTNLESDILITNTKLNEYLFSVDDVNYYTDKLPIKDLGNAGTAKILYIKRAKRTYGMSVSDITFTNGAITRTLTLASLLESKANDVWRTPTFENSWVNYSADLQSARYTIDRNNIVHIQGVVKSGTATTIFTLESIYRPSVDNLFITQDNVGIATILVNSSGEVQIDDASKNTKVSINISYKL